MPCSLNVIGEYVTKSERAAAQFLHEKLQEEPGHWYLMTNVEVANVSGRREIDIIATGPTGVYVVDVKSFGGKVRAEGDWASEPVARFATEVGSFTTVAETVPSKMFGRGSVYRKEWNAPDERRPVAIDSITFMCPGGKAGGSVPILLGITGVTEW